MEKSFGQWSCGYAFSRDVAGRFEFWGVGEEWIGVPFRVTNVTTIGDGGGEGRIGCPKHTAT